MARRWWKRVAVGLATFMTYLDNIVLFYQAEDGIRGGRVTGVQTCALPISWQRRRGPHGRLAAVLADAARDRDPRHRLPLREARRSEERRVGKECRTRWWPDV